MRAKTRPCSVGKSLGKGDIPWVMAVEQESRMTRCGQEGMMTFRYTVNSTVASGIPDNEREFYTRFVFLFWTVGVVVHQLVVDRNLVDVRAKV